MTAAMTRTVGDDTLPAAGTWSLDPSHTSVGFSVRHLGLSKVRGRFSSFTGDVVVAEDPSQSSVQVAVDVTSIDTRDDKRDEHLRTNDFFDATFNGSGVNPWGQTVASWSATTEIDREAWGMNFNAALEAGGVLVGTNVKVAIEIEAVRQS